MDAVHLLGFLIQSEGFCDQVDVTCFPFMVQILRQKVLEFLEPLVGLFGMQIMASVGAVWNSRRSKKRHSQNKASPSGPV